MVFIFKWLHSQLMVTPAKPAVSLTGKTIIVTGSNTGLGKEACRWIVQLGASKVIIACRNVEKGKSAAKDIQSTTSLSASILEVWELDLSSYPSIKHFADRAKIELPRLDAVLLNAGVTARTFRMFNGNEEMINTNVISCALLAFLLYPKLHETATRFNTQPHLTVTTSEVHELAKFKERNALPGQIFTALAEEENFNLNDRYMTSKLLEIFFVKQLAAVCSLTNNNVIINAINPGFCASELIREYDLAPLRLFTKILGRTTEVGSRTLVAGAIAGPESHGQYMTDSKVAASKGLAKEGDKAADLQHRFWLELKEKLEGIIPGVTDLNQSDP